MTGPPGSAGTPRLATRLAAPPAGWTVRADVIVVGSGIAGLTTALQLRRRVGRVLLVTKTVLESGSTRWAQGGIAAALDPEDSPEEHLADTLAAGAGLCDPDAARALVTEGPQRVRELAGIGAHFDRTPAGGLALTREGGHHRHRIVHAGGDATGAEVSRALIAALEAVRDDPGIEVIEHAVVLDLLTTGQPSEPGHRVAGVTLHVIGAGSRDGVGAAIGRAVVLATGGIGQVFQSTTNPKEATGDGVAAALRAGAFLADLEFVQFHPTVLWLGAGARGQQPLISEAVRGEGAVLLDADGVRFMPQVHPMAELAPRDVVAKAIVRRMATTGDDHVYLDCRRLGRAFLARRFPTVVSALAEHGFDPAEEPVPVAPAQHFHSGGVLVDSRGRAGVAGLYAVGEVSCTGVHGANRLASNSLLEGLVFAHRIADDLADQLGRGRLPAVEPDPPQDRKGAEALLAATARPAVQKAASSGPGVIRTAAGLATAAGTLAALPSDAHLRPGVSAAPGTAEWETTNLHAVASALTHVATLREETRGGHYREDFPDRDDARWLGRLVAYLDPDGGLVTDFVPLVARRQERG